MDKHSIRIIYMGTPDFAVESLRALVDGGYNVVAVVTMPDKPAGRGHQLQFSAVKQYALSVGLPVLQPERLKAEEFLTELRSYNADLQIVVAFRMLPEVVWNMPRLGTFNLHASLLPQYRGAAPIQWCIVDGEKVTGITTMLMNEGLDTGDMLLKEEIVITDTMTGGELHDKMAAMCPALLLETLDKIDEIVPEKQDDTLSCYASMIDKSMTVIDWNKSAEEILTSRQRTGCSDSAILFATLASIPSASGSSTPVF